MPPIQWRSCLLACVVACIVTAAAPAQCADKVLLRLKFAEGDVQKYRMTAVQDIEQTVMGSEMSMVQTIVTEHEQRVTAVADDGTADIELVYQAFKLKMEGMGMPGGLEFDSRKDPETDPPGMGGLRVMVGKVISLKIHPDGDVSDVKGADKIFEELMESMGPEAGMFEQLKGQFGDEAQEQNMEKLLKILPEEPVGEGDSWDVEMEVEIGLPVVTKTNYTVKSIADGLVTLDVEGKVTCVSGEKGTMVGPMTAFYDLKGDQKGTVVLLVENGFTIESKVNQDVSGTMRMTGMPGGGEDMTMPMTIKSVVGVGLVKDDDEPSSEENQ